MPVTPAYIAKPLAAITDAEKSAFIQSLRDDLAKARLITPVPGPKPGYATKAIDQMNEAEKLDAIQSLRADLNKATPATTTDLALGGSAASQQGPLAGQPGYPNQPGLPAFGPASPMPPIQVIQHMSSNNHAMAVLDAGWENGTLVVHVS